MNTSNNGSGYIDNFFRPRSVFRLLLESPEVDGLIVAVNVWQQSAIDSILDMMALCRSNDKPAAIYPLNSIERILYVRKKFRIPVFETPEEAVRALVVSHQYFSIQAKKNKDRSPVSPGCARN
jgi:acyl-CoA synthetase (NDP forming)